MMGRSRIYGFGFRDESGSTMPPVAQWELLRRLPRPLWRLAEAKSSKTCFRRRSSSQIAERRSALNPKLSTPKTLKPQTLSPKRRGPKSPSGSKQSAPRLRSRRPWPGCKSLPLAHISCSLNSLKGDYMGDYIGVLWGLLRGILGV